jgi:hypothetical protein
VPIVCSCLQVHAHTYTHTYMLSLCLCLCLCLCPSLYFTYYSFYLCFTHCIFLLLFFFGERYTVYVVDNVTVLSHTICRKSRFTAYYWLKFTNSLLYASNYYLLYYMLLAVKVLSHTICRKSRFPFHKKVYTVNEKKISKQKKCVCTPSAAWDDAETRSCRKRVNKVYIVNEITLRNAFSSWKVPPSVTWCNTHIYCMPWYGTL